MAHCACVIATAKDLGLPYGLPEIIAEYAKLDDGERLQQMFRFGSTITLTLLSNVSCIYIQDTSSGIEISSNVTGDDRDRLDWMYFMEAMNSCDIELVIMDDMESWSPYYSDLEYLKRKLIDLWWSI